MKILIGSCALLAAALFSVAAQSTDTQSLGSIQACMDKFVADNFANRKVTFKVEESPPLMPLDANTGTRQVEVIAREKTSGKVLVKGTCTAKPGEAKIGRIVVTPE